VGQPGSLLTSTGFRNWDFVCWAAGHQRLPQILAVPWDGNEEASKVLLSQHLVEFHLDPDRVTLVLLPVKGIPKGEIPAARDRFLIENADTILPISIRPGGKLQGLLQMATPSLKIDSAWSVDWTPGTPLPGYSLDPEAVRQDMDTRYTGTLIHWTRASASPWPGESLASFFEGVIESGEEYCRSARRTLEHIVTEGTLRASSWRIRGGMGAVSFSALAPSQAIRLMRWRKRYVRYTVEPYGIAIGEEAARLCGIQPVCYLERRETAPNQPEYLLQGRGLRGDWPQEQEYRHLGDLDLSPLPSGSWRPIDLT
jgi:hypothetical protein